MYVGAREGGRLALASRSGALAGGTAVEWDAVRATAAASLLERCDASEESHVHRLVVATAPRAGVWHAAGVLADGVLPTQCARSLAAGSLA